MHELKGKPKNIITEERIGYPKLILTRAGEKGIMIHTHRGYRFMIVYDKKGRIKKNRTWSKWYKEFR